VQESSFGSGKIAEGDIGNAKKQECVVIVVMEFQFAFELQAELADRLPRRGTRGWSNRAGRERGILWVELNGLRKLGDRGLRKTADGIGAAMRTCRAAESTHGFLRAETIAGRQ